MFVRSFGWIPRRRRSRISSMRNSVSIESCRRGKGDEACSLSGRSLRYAAAVAAAAVAVAIIAYKGSALRKRANNERASQPRVSAASFN